MQVTLNSQIGTFLQMFIITLIQSKWNFFETLFQWIRPDFLHLRLGGDFIPHFTAQGQVIIPGMIMTVTSLKRILHTNTPNFRSICQEYFYHYFF